MLKTEPRTLKGFRDFLPAEARKRQYATNIFKKVFEKFGFEPLETPVLEYEEILAGKYGEEGDKLMYRFEDLGQRKVAMRYDQTVPLARVVAQYENQIAFPFKRYQISPVWRAENTQKGRFREFYQCDIDTVGPDTSLTDAEIIATTITAFKELGFKNFKILLNDRAIFKKLTTEAIIIIDKLKKIGADNVCKELAEKKISTNFEEAKDLLNSLLNQKPTERLNEIIKDLEQFGVDKSYVEFSPVLARGLDYYTGVIFETIVAEYPYGSFAGGGRFNNLIGLFINQTNLPAGRQVPAVGVAFGFDRIIDAMQALELFPPEIEGSPTQILVTIFSEELKNKSLAICKELRNNNINTEIYLGEIKEKNPLEKQLKYADQKGIQNAIILGPQEAEKNLVTLKNLKTREQKQMTLEDTINLLESLSKPAYVISKE